MVRLNLIHPKYLSDQHLIAEYSEILVLLGGLKKHPNPRNIPESYRLGKGHIQFFKDKVKYLKNRHEVIKKEMKKRGFKPTKTIKLTNFPPKLRKDWRPKKKDKDIIKKRLISRIRKPKRIKQHTYYRKKKPKHFFIENIKMG